MKPTAAADLDYEIVLEPSLDAGRTFIHSPIVRLRHDVATSRCGYLATPAGTGRLHRDRPGHAGHPSHFFRDAGRTERNTMATTVPSRPTPSLSRRRSRACSRADDCSRRRASLGISRDDRAQYLRLAAKRAAWAPVRLAAPARASSSHDVMHCSWRQRQALHETTRARDSSVHARLAHLPWPHHALAMLSVIPCLRPDVDLADVDVAAGSRAKASRDPVQRAWCGVGSTSGSVRAPNEPLLMMAAFRSAPS